MNEQVSMSGDGGTPSPESSESPTQGSDSTASSESLRSYASTLDEQPDQLAQTMKTEFHTHAPVVGRDVDEEKTALLSEIEGLKTQYAEPTQTLEYNPDGSDWTTAKGETEAQLVATLLEKQEQLHKLEEVDRRNFFIPAPASEAEPEPDDPEEELEPAF